MRINRDQIAIGIAGAFLIVVIFIGVEVVRAAMLVQPAIAEATPTGDPTPIMEVTAAPDPYAACLSDEMSKRHCLAIAKQDRYRLTAHDRTLWQSTPEPDYTQAPESEPTPVSASIADRPQRAVAQRYWSATIGFMAMAGSAIEFAGESIQSGDAVTAQQLLTTAEQQADMAYQAASNDEPSGDAWTGIQGDLMNAASTYKKAIGELKDGLGTGNSETVASALDDSKNAGDLMTNATHDARIWYQQNGGKWSDLEDYPTAEHAVASTLKSLAGSR